MEDNLMEKLLTDFAGVLNDFNQLVENKDVEGVKSFLAEVNRLIQEQNGIQLDDREPQYDHVLHELLSKLEGTIDRVEETTGIDYEPGARLYTNNQVIEILQDIENQLKVQAEKLNVGKNEGNDQMVAEAESERQRLLAERDRFASGLVEDSEYSTITYVDEKLKELQEKRAKLVQEKMDNLREIARLKEEQTPVTVSNPEIEARLKKLREDLEVARRRISDTEGYDEQEQAVEEYNSIYNQIQELESQENGTNPRIAELEEIIQNLEENITDIKEKNIGQLIEELDSQGEIDPEIEARLEKLREDFESLIPTREVRENVLDPMDYTYMGRLSDEQIIRRLLSEQLHLSDEEIEATIGEYSLVQADDGAHDEQGEDNPISMRQLVRTRTVRDENITIGEILDNLEAQSYNEDGVDHSQEIAEIDNRIAELDEIINNAQARINEINSDLLNENNEENKSESAERLEELNKKKQELGKRIEETKGYDEANAQAHAEYEEVIRQINELEGQQKDDIDYLQEIEDKRKGIKNAKARKRRAEKYIANIAKEEKEKLEKLNKELEVVGKRIEATKGFDTANAQAHADYNKIVNEINELNSQIKSKQDRFKDEILKRQEKIKVEEEIIKNAQREKEELEVRKKALEQNGVRKENPEIRAKINQFKENIGITALEKQLEEARAELARLQAERESLTQGNNKQGVDNSARIAELEQKNKKIIEDIGEIDRQIKGIPGIHTPGSQSTDKLDIKAEANKIGDKIFKTAAIRREMADKARNLTLDDFLTFYKEGSEMTEEQIKQLNDEFRDISREVGIVVVDREGNSKTINTQIKEAKEAGDTEQTIKLCEKLRQNFIEAGREDQLNAMGLDHEISSEEDVNKMAQFFKAYRESVDQEVRKLQLNKDNLMENKMIFDREIKRIEDEKETKKALDGATTIEELRERAKDRRELRKKLLIASITPEQDLTEEQEELLDSWQDASEKFLSKKTTKQMTYIDREGNEQTIDVDTIDSSYEQYKQDVEFLGVPAYKENLEQISAFDQTQDPYVFGQDIGRLYDAAEAQREGAGAEVINKVMADKRKYVETFNGIPNPHKVKYENWKTAGSTLKGMKPVSRDLPVATRAKNTLENVGRFFGIRAPKFKRIDEHGNEVNDPKSGIATLVLDGLVVGAVVGSAVTVGPALAISGYLAKGLVTGGNRIAARIEYAKHRDEIDGNVPVLNQADSNAREVARKEYYRTHGNNKFVSWAKAKADKYFTRGRAKETDMAIVLEEYENYEESDEKILQAQMDNLKKSKSNAATRIENARQTVLGENAYNDMVRDPYAVNQDKAMGVAARNALLNANGKEGREDLNSSSKEQRKNQYVKEEKPLGKTEDLDQTAFETQSGQVSAITEEQIYTGRKQKVDRINKILTILTTAGLKFGYTAWKNKFLSERVIHHDAEIEKETIKHDAEYKDVDITETQYDTGKTLGELRKNYIGKKYDTYYSVSGGKRGEEAQKIADKGITAIWADDGTKYGTGVSDTAGLTAEGFTDRLISSNLIDSNGVLRQDITVEQLIKALGVDSADSKTLEGLYCSIGDQYWVSLKDLMSGMTKEVVTGTKKVLVKEAWEEVKEVVKKEAYDEIVKEFDVSNVLKAILEGGAAGAAISAADALHEAAQTTYINDATPGRPDEVTPDAEDTFDKIGRKLQEKENREKEYNMQKKDKEEYDGDEEEYDGDEEEYDGDEEEYDDDGRE